MLGFIILCSLLPYLEAAPKPVAIGALPTVFEMNRGQAESDIRFLARGSKSLLFLKQNSVEVAIPRTGEVVRLVPLNANPKPKITGADSTGGLSHYLKGTEPNWVRDVPQFQRVRYEQIYPGVEMVFYGTQKELEFDMMIRPHTDPGVIRFEVRGAKKLSTARDGSLILKTEEGELRLGKPIAYQMTAKGRKEVACDFRLSKSNFSFRLGEYDADLPLVIDPTLTNSYLGGNGIDIISAVATDSTGAIYVTGYTTSTNFPLSASPFKNSIVAGDADAFVVKLNTTASAIVYSTYMGGTFADYAHAIAVDSSGSAYITGSSVGRFPTTVGAFREVPSDSPAIFAAKLGTAGNSLSYSTYLDGAGSGNAIAVDASSNAYVTGYTYTASFTTTSGAPQRVYAGGIDAFLVKLNSAGSSEAYATFLGGSSEDQGTAVAIDNTGNAYVTGFTSSGDFPITSGSFRTAYSGSTDAFVTKVNTAGSALSYSTYLGASNVDRGYGIAVNTSGEAYIAGQTYSTSYPTTTGAFRTSHGGGNADAFVTRLNAAGTNLVYSTFLGGTGVCTVTDPFRSYQCDAAHAIALDSSGNAFVTGLAGGGFQLAGAIQSTPGGNGDAFVTQLNPTGTTLFFSTYIGGSSGDVATGIALSSTAGPIVVGFSASTDFPTTPGALQTVRGGGAQEGFFSRLADCPVTLSAASSFFNPPSGTFDLGVQAASSCAWYATTNVSWVTINSASGAGNGLVNYTVASNSGPFRTGQITVAGQTFTINQLSGQCITLGSSGSWFNAAGGTYSLSVFATCAWAVSSNQPWIVINGPFSGTGNGFVFYTIQSNTGASARFGQIDVTGQIFSVSQVGAGGLSDCSFQFSSSGDTVGRSGGSGSFLVSTIAGCEWTLVNPTNWITLTSQLAGSGEGIVGYTVAPNPTGQTRVGVLTLAGNNFTITQSAQ